jgi:ferredoxin
MAKVNNKCIGCGVCLNVCPDGFEMKANKALVKNQEASCLEEAAKACPVGAIELDGGNSSNENNSSNNDFVPGMGQGGGQGRGMGQGGGQGRGMGRGDGQGGGMGRGMGRGR